MPNASLPPKQIKYSWNTLSYRRVLWTKLNIENTEGVDGLPYARFRPLTNHFNPPVSQLDFPETSTTNSGPLYVNDHINSVQFGSVKLGNGLGQVYGVGTEDGGVVPPGDNAEVVEGSSMLKTTVMVQRDSAASENKKRLRGGERRVSGTVSETRELRELEAS